MQGQAYGSLIVTVSSATAWSQYGLTVADSYYDTKLTVAGSQTRHTGDHSLNCVGYFVI